MTADTQVTTKSAAYLLGKSGSAKPGLTVAGTWVVLSPVASEIGRAEPGALQVWGHSLLLKTVRRRCDYIRWKSQAHWVAKRLPQEQTSLFQLLIRCVENPTEEAHHLLPPSWPMKRAGEAAFNPPLVN